MLLLLHPGDWTSQKFLGSMEGATLGGKLAAEVVAARAKGLPTKGLKAVQPDIVAKAKAWKVRTLAHAWSRGGSFLPAPVLTRLRGSLVLLALVLR